MAEQMENQLEFRLLNPTEGGFLQEIKWNKEELETALAEKMKEYEGVVYTEDTMKQAKLDRAELNKLDKAIEDRRKEVKNYLMNPYTKFEAEVKEVRALIQKPISQIDGQVKAYEAKLKEEKQTKIRAVYEDKAGDLQSIIPFERLFESRWLNQTVALKKAQDELTEKIETIRRDLETIGSIDSKYKLNAKDVYIQTLDLSKALAENKRLTDLEVKLEEERRRKEEEARKREEELRRQAEQEAAAKEQTVEEPVTEEPTEEPAEVPAEQPAEKHEEQSEEPEQKEEVPTEEKRYKIKFQATATRAKLEALVEYMKQNGIEYTTA